MITRIANVWNDLEDPAEYVNPDLEALGTEHQLFFTGTAIGSLLEHSYADADANGLPVGLSNTIRTVDRGIGELTVTLRDLPEHDQERVKVAGLADEVAANGLNAIRGYNHLQATFVVEVQ